MEEQIDFHRDGYRLFGMLHRPEGTARGAVLFLHGFGGHRAEAGRLFVRTARRLLSRGIASLRFDFAGSGDSEGEDTDSTILSQLEDAVVAFQLLQGTTRSEPSALGVLGYSLGGAVAALLCARVTFQTLVLWAPVSDPLGNFSEHLEMKPEELLQLQGYDVGHRQVSSQFIGELPKLRPLEAVRQFRGRLLTIHGTDDQVVLPYNSDRYAQAAQGTARETGRVDIEGAGHSFAGLENNERLIEQTVLWFSAYLGQNGQY